MILKGELKGDKKISKNITNVYLKHKLSHISNKTYTITFGDQAENHVGMQKLGVSLSKGFSYEDLLKVRNFFDNKGYKTELIDLSLLLPHELRGQAVKLNEAHVLVIRKGLRALLPSNNDEKDFFKEQQGLEYDKKAFMYGRVVNKHARHNIVFATIDQEPEYKEGKGRVVSFDNEKIKLLNQVRLSLINIVGNQIKDIVAEGNYYYDIKKTGIGWHGDSERFIVIGIRSGATMPLYYRWYYKNNIVSPSEKIILNDGDVYFMSEKASGNDWKKKNIYTLRHSAGSEKYIK